MGVGRGDRSAMSGTALRGGKRRAPDDDLADRLKSLGEIASDVSSEGDLVTVLGRIATAVCRHSSWTSSGIMAIDRDEGYSVLVANYDPYAKPKMDYARRWQLDTSPTLAVIAENRPLVIDDAPNDDRYPGYREDARSRGYVTAALFPLNVEDGHGRPMVLSVQSRQRIPVGEDDLAFLEAVTSLARLAVEKGNRLRAEQAQADKLQQALGAHARLMDVVLRDSSLRGVSATIETLLPHPFIVVDATAGTVVCGRSPAPDRFPETLWRDLLASKAARHLTTFAHTFEPSDAERMIDLRTFGIDFTAAATVAPLTVDGERVGAFIVFPGEDPLDDLELLIANAVKFALAVQMMRGLISFRVETRSLSDLLGQLFRGEWSNREDLVARAGQFGLPLDRPARLLVVAGSAGSAADDSHFLRNLTRAARIVRPDARAATDGGDIVVVAHVSDTENDRAWSRLAHRVAEEAQALFDGAIVAASGVCYRLEDFGAAREACRRAINLAQMFDKRGLIAESEFGPYALLLSAMDREAMRRFVQDRLGPILAYDDRHGGGLAPTLEAFLASGCRYQACANAMAIHVTTLRYRLSRVSELFNISLEDPDSRFGLDLALRLRRMMEPLPASIRS